MAARTCSNGWSTVVAQGVAHVCAPSERVRGGSQAGCLAASLGADVVHVQPAHGLDDLLQCRGGQGAGLGEDQDAVAEGHQGGDRGDPGRGGECLLGLGVDLAEHDVGVRARTPPRRPARTGGTGRTRRPRSRPGRCRRAVMVGSKFCAVRCLGAHWVSPWSAELRLYLPGYAAYDKHGPFPARPGIPRGTSQSPLDLTECPSGVTVLSADTPLGIKSRRKERQ